MSTFSVTNISSSFQNKDITTVLVVTHNNNIPIRKEWKYLDKKSNEVLSNCIFNYECDEMTIQDVVYDIVNTLEIMSVKHTITLHNSTNSITSNTNKEGIETGTEHEMSILFNTPLNESYKYYVNDYPITTNYRELYKTLLFGPKDLYDDNDEYDDMSDPDFLYPDSVHLYSEIHDDFVKFYYAR